MKDIYEHLSKSRLSSFDMNHDTDDLILARYLWNVELSKELYFSLHFFEVVLRNSIHNSFKKHFQSDFWFDQSQFIDMVKDIAKARSEIRKNGAETADDIIAKLNLGFWCRLLNKKYDKIWHKTIIAVFPSLKRKERSRHKIQPKIENIRRLRNRVFHHEPIYNMADLSEIYQCLIELISGISPKIQQVMNEQCKFCTTLSKSELAFLPLAQKILTS